MECVCLYVCLNPFRTPQPTLSLDKDGMPQERPGGTSRHARKKQKRAAAEPELSSSDEYSDFPEQRHDGPIAEFTSALGGDERETSSAVQSIQQVSAHLFHSSYLSLSLSPPHRTRGEAELRS